MPGLGSVDGGDDDFVVGSPWGWNSALMPGSDWFCPGSVRNLTEASQAGAGRNGLLARVRRIPVLYPEVCAPALGSPQPPSAPGKQCLQW